MRRMLFIIIAFLLQACGAADPQVQGTQNSSDQIAKYSNWSTVKKIDIGSSTSAVTAVDKYIYITDGLNGLSIANVTSLTDILLFNKVIDPSVQYNPNYGYYDALYNIKISGSIACISVNAACPGMCQGDLTEIRLYDITDRSKPIKLAIIQLNPEDILVEGSYIYVTGNKDLSSELNIIDISNPSQPKILSTLSINGPGKLAKQGNKIYVSQVRQDFTNIDNYKNIQVVDVTNPSVPILEGNPSGWSSFNISYSPILVTGNTAYISSTFVGQVSILDMSNISEPVLIKTIHLTDSIYSMAMYGSYLYLACGNEGVKIYDIANPQDPVLVKIIATKTPAKYVAITGGRGVYVTDALIGQNGNLLEPQKLNIFYINQ